MRMLRWMWGSDTQRQDQEQTNEDAAVDVGSDTQRQDQEQTNEDAAVDVGERHAKTRSGTN